jgi:hypothetical protein
VCQPNWPGADFSAAPFCNDSPQHEAFFVHGWPRARLPAKDDEYRCAEGERAIYRFSTLEKNGLNAHVNWTSARPACSIKNQCTTGDYRSIRRWEDEEVLERVQQRLDKKPEAMTLRRRTVEHVFGRLKHWMGSTHFLTKTLAHVGTEMSLHVLACKLKRVVAILGMRKTMKAVRLVGREPLYGASTTRRGPAGLQIRSCPSTATGWPARLPVAIAMRMLGILERRRRFHTASAKSGPSWFRVGIDETELVAFRVRTVGSIEIGCIPCSYARGAKVEG